MQARFVYEFKEGRIPEGFAGKLVWKQETLSRLFARREEFAPADAAEILDSCDCAAMKTVPQAAWSRFPLLRSIAERTCRVAIVCIAAAPGRSMTLTARRRANGNPDEPWYVEACRPATFAEAAWHEAQKALAASSHQLSECERKLDDAEAELALRNRRYRDLEQRLEKAEAAAKSIARELAADPKPYDGARVEPCSESERALGEIVSVRGRRYAWQAPEDCAYTLSDAANVADCSCAYELPSGAACGGEKAYRVGLSEGRLLVAVLVRRGGGLTSVLDVYAAEGRWADAFFGFGHAPREEARERELRAVA